MPYLRLGGVCFLWLTWDRGHVKVICWPVEEYTGGVMNIDLEARVLG